MFIDSSFKSRTLRTLLIGAALLAGAVAYSAQPSGKSTAGAPPSTSPATSAPNNAPALIGGLSLEQWKDVVSSLAPQMTPEQRAAYAKGLRDKFDRQDVLTKLPINDVADVVQMLRDLKQNDADGLLVRWLEAPFEGTPLPSGSGTQSETDQYLARLRIAHEAKTIKGDARKRIIKYVFTCRFAIKPEIAPALATQPATQTDELLTDTVKQSPRCFTMNQWIQIVTWFSRDLSVTERADLASRLQSYFSPKPNYEGLTSEDVKRLAILLKPLLPDMPSADAMLVEWACAAPLPKPLAPDSPLPGAPKPSLSTGFDSSPKLDVRQLSDTHFIIDTKGKVDLWFMLRLEGVKGRTIRIDMTGVNWKQTWSRLNPVYATLSDMDDPIGFRSQRVVKKGPYFPALNGTKLPETKEQQWHFISRVWQGITPPLPKDSKQEPSATTRNAEVTGDTFSFIEHFESDSVVVAWRYPFTPGHYNAYLDQLSERATKRQPIDLAIIDLGKSRSGKPLRLVKIGVGKDEDEKTKPCVLIYGREHADEQDPSWACQGAIEYLLSDDKEAARLRKGVTFLIIPLLDPDGAADAVHDRILNGFVDDGSGGVEARNYASFFRQWVQAGKRLDLCINLHNTGASELPHLTQATWDIDPARREMSKHFHAFFINSNFTRAGYSLRRNEGGRGNGAFRLSGYLRQFYGTLVMPYELNSQMSPHLTIEDLRYMGQCFAQATGSYLLSKDAAALLQNVDARRATHKARSEKYEANFKLDDDALRIEWESMRIEARENPLAGAPRNRPQPAKRTK